MKYSEETVKTWTAPLSDTEEQRAENAGRIEEGGTAVPDGVYCQQLGGKPDAFRVERAVKLIPQVIENFRKILSGSSEDRHAAGECTIKIRMGANLTRHDNFFFGVDFFFGRILREQLGG